MIFAVVDVETSVADSDLNPLKDECCEFAIIVADYETKSIITQFSHLYSVNKWNNSSAEVHKIPEALAQNQIRAEVGLVQVEHIIDISKIDYIIAHNASYDKNVIARYWSGLSKSKWLCSHLDFDHPKLHKVTSKRLSHLAADYGILIPDWHRAHSDCLALVKIAYEHDLDAAWQRKNIRRFNIKTHGDYKSGAPEQFKAHDWRWDASKKQWSKNTPADQLKADVELAQKLGYKVTVEEVFKNY